jgi:hypothetical protein
MSRYISVALMLCIARPASAQIVSPNQIGFSGVTTTSSSPTTYTGTTATLRGAYVKDQPLIWNIGATACTGGVPMTLNINGLGAKSVFEADGSTNPQASDCTANRTVQIAYDGVSAFKIIGGGIVGGGGGPFFSTETSGACSWAASITIPLAAVSGKSPVRFECGTMTADTTITFSGQSAGAGVFSVVLKQDATGGRKVLYGGTVTGTAWTSAGGRATYTLTQW